MSSDSDSFDGDAGGHDFEGGERIDAVPLFPLPGVVLLPGAILPLHVFERRYRQMTRHAVEPGYDGRRLIGICRVKGEPDPMSEVTPIYDVACVARIIDHQRLPDGRFNVLVQGTARVQLDDEAELFEEVYPGEPLMYRRADLEVLSCKGAFEIDLGDARERMLSICRRPPILGTPVAGQLEKLFTSPLPTTRLADVLAFDLLDDADVKQELLEDLDDRHRTERIAALLDEQFPEPDSIKKLGDRFKVDE
ncbi:MAG: LON peptidase substrate-binding domain-containing protein [Planctomycetota bacterium]